MSADLFAAFGDPNPSSQPAATSSTPSAAPASERDDGGNGLNTLMDSSLSFGKEIPTGENRRRGESQVSRPLDPEDSSQFTNSGGNEVLFDASFESTEPADSDDEWGEFETANSGNQGSTGGLLIDIPEDTPRSATLSSSNVQEQHRGHDKLPAIDFLSQNAEPAVKQAGSEKIVTPKLRTSPRQDTPVLFSSLASAEEEDEEDWGEFTDGIEPASATAVQSQPVPQAPIEVASHLPSHQSPSAAKGTTDHATKSQTGPTTLPTASQIRPTNIPPPVVLLSLFPSILEEIQQKCVPFLSSLRAKGSPPPQSPLPVEVASVLKVMLRVLLGRSLRWKRDSILAQSTRIGPARSGKAGGMKLSSVNKSESVKEDKEAVEVQNAWKKRAGVLNSVVTATSQPPVPQMTAGLQVKIAATDEGALKSSHACALCGIKREERISKLDHDVNDSFGEWWTDHWGHSECKDFWEAHSKRLDQR